MLGSEIHQVICTRVSWAVCFYRRGNEEETFGNSTALPIGHRS